MQPPRIDRLLRKGRAMFLSYDEGLEHGPAGFTEQSVDPQKVLDIALEGEYTGIILQAGVAEKYYRGAYKNVPLIVKLNGKTSLPHSEPLSRQNCSVSRAVKLGADAVGYTIYDGSRQEPEIFREFGRIVEQAHDFGIPVIAWVYPRGKDVHDAESDELLAYSARIALELGADFVKLKYNGDLEHLGWVKQCAGRTKVIISAGHKMDPDEFLQEAYDVIVEGEVCGMAVGRNIWQSEKPFTLSKALEQIVFRKKRLDQISHLRK